MRLLQEIRSRLGNYHLKSGMFHYFRAEYSQAMEYLEKAIASGRLSDGDLQLARSYMDKGQLVPDSVVVGIVASRLEQDDAVGGALFDGFPRTVRQAELLQEWLVDHGRSIGGVINLVVPDDEVVARLSGRRTCMGCGATYHAVHNPPATEGTCDRCGGDVVQRDDDREETVRARIDTYHRETKPVLTWLRDNAAVVDVEANQPIADVRSAVLRALDGLRG